MGHLRRGTPSAGLDIVTDTLPLHHFIQGEIMKAAIRLDKLIPSEPLQPSREKMDVSKIKFRHLNHQLRSQSIDMMEKECRGNDLFITFGNEPHAPFSTISGLNK